MTRTLVIAEPGCTHEGSREQMLRLLETAHACGADVFKPQWTSNPQQMCERRHIGVDHPKRAYYERAYGWNSFPIAWHAEFRRRCYALDMQYAVTCFLPQDVATVAPFVDYHKVASFEAMDADMVAAHRARSTRGDVIVSMGMVGDIDEFQNLWRGQCGQYLHCVSAYPAPMEAMNLAAMHEQSDGLSDHSRHLLTGALAVALGSHVIETHYRLDDCDPENPDYAVAFSPAEFAQNIQNIRDAEIMLGSGEKRIQDCEREYLAYRVIE